MNINKDYAVEKFSPADLSEMTLREADKGRHGFIAGAQFSDEMFASVLKMMSTARTLVYRNQPISCFGIMRIHAKMGEAWIYCDEKVRDHGLTLFKIVRKSMWIVESEKGYERVQAVARTDWTTANRFLDALGFIYECTMRKYGIDGSDYNLYARVH